MGMVEIKERYKEWIIQGGAALAVGIFAFFVLIQPVFRDIRTLKTDIRDATVKLELYRSIQNLKKTLAGLEKPLGLVAERAMLLGKISDLAGSSGISVQGMTPKTEPSGAYTKLLMDIDMRCSFSGLLNFLRTLQEMVPPVDIQDVSVTQAARPDSEDMSGPMMLQGKLVVSTYLRQEKAIQS
ncbi:MAG: Pilus assembly protein, PilO [Candidatus Omnitrophica bacterium ADurb.Bin277]|nr:MAG: Pilus assembly protein, PilO [Candidatus Omnitrophica bacterium ADurb.Bin277]